MNTGDCGQLGLGDLENRTNISINNSFPPLAQISAGANHTTVLTKSGQVYTWGHGANGRLGTGKTERYGVPDKEKYYFPVPSLLSTLVYKAKERFFFVGLNSFFPILLGENSSGVLWLRLYFSHWSVWGEC